jgi:hypothetical protein
MRYGILRHVSGNIFALRKADRLFNLHGAERKVCIGDIVGAYPFVDDCIQFLTEKEYLILKSHRDHYFAQNGPYFGWSSVLMVAALEYAYPRTKKSTLNKISRLPVTLVDSDCRFISALLSEEGLQGVYTGYNDETPVFDMYPESVIFHSGSTGLYLHYEGESNERIRTEEGTLRADKRAMICPGGIGSGYAGPTEGHSAMVYNSNSRKFTIVKPEWDPDRFKSKLRNSGYPSGLIRSFGVS